MSIRFNRSPASHRALITLAAATALALVTLPLAATTATAAPAAPTNPGLFGVQDATFDGVYRQSLAILAYTALDAEPPAIAVDWLLDQQCSNGGWQAFRSDTDTPCAASNIATYAGPDSNSTAVAVQALAAIGEFDAAGDGLDFLESLQQSDGGIAYLEGAASDTNSTALTAMATSSVGIPLSDTDNGSGNTLQDALASAQIGCEGAPADRGGYRFQIPDDPFGNNYASSQAVLGATSLALPVLSTGSDDDQAAPTCPATDEPSVADRTAAGAWYLAQRLDAGNGTIESAFSPGTADWSSTRFAVISLAASGHGRTAMTDALAALAGSQATTIADDNAQDRPGVLAELILANEAAQSALTPLSTRSQRSSAPATANAPKSQPTSRPPSPAVTAASPTGDAPATSDAPSPEASLAPRQVVPTIDAAPTPTATPSSPVTPTVSPSEAAATSPAPATPQAPAISKAPASPKSSVAPSRVRAQAQAPAIDSDALLDRLDATLQQAAITSSPVTTSEAPSTTTAPTSDDEGSGSNLARTGGVLPLGAVLPAAAALLVAGIALLVLTSRRVRGTH